MTGFLSDPAVQLLFTVLPEARVVGGAVRDCLAGRAVADIDFATPRLPHDVVSALAAAGIRSVPTGLAHGTVTAIVDHRGFEITTLRRDVATDGRRATVAFSTDWREDAARRDFTINAMSMASDGTLFDYFGGQDDLRAGVLRFVGDPTVRIAEDYLRILRFFRFFARYGRDKADSSAVGAIRSGLAGLSGLSVERVWHELSGLLSLPDPAAAVVLMDATGVLAAILPEGAAVVALVRLIRAEAPINPVLRLAALLTGDALVVATRLKLSVAERQHLLALRQACSVGPGDSDAALRRALVDVAHDVVLGRMWLVGGADPAWADLRVRLIAMPRPVFPLMGRDVVAMGVPAGPRVGQLHDAVRQWWLERGCVDGQDACQRELRRLIAL